MLQRGCDQATVKLTGPLSPDIDEVMRVAILVPPTEFGLASMCSVGAGRELEF